MLLLLLLCGCKTGVNAEGNIAEETKKTKETVEEAKQEIQQAEEKAANQQAEEPAGTIIEEPLSLEETDALFYAQEISDQVLARINGISYVENENIALSELRYLRLLHTGFDGKTHIGELIVHESIADTMLEIFRTLYENQYQIEKMLLVDAYGGDDHASMLDNNTSAFNYRVVDGSTKLSKHAYGLAIDINPFYNPFVTYENGQECISPEGSEPYARREEEFPHKIGEGDLCWQLFKEQGFTWGGDWKTMKDYQHFQISQLDK